MTNQLKPTKSKRIGISSTEGNPLGPPSGYTRAITDQILFDIAGGSSAKGACREWSVNSGTFFSWVLDDVDGLSSRYARAMQLRALNEVSELTEIVDDGSNDWMETKFGPKVNNEVVQRSRLRFEHRRWVAEMFLPEQFGGKPKNQASQVTIVLDNADVKALGFS